MRPGPSLSVGVLCLVVAGRAAAMSCLSPGWDDAGVHSPLDEYADDVPEVPVDAWPWRVDDCYFDGSAVVPACVFVRTDEPDAAEIAVTDEVLGVEGCEDDERATYIRRFAATAPLIPGHVRGPVRRSERAQRVHHA